MKTEQYWENEFDRLYMEGKVAQDVLDDDFNKAKDKWIEEKMKEEIDLLEQEQVENGIQPLADEN